MFSIKHFGRIDPRIRIALVLVFIWLINLVFHFAWPALIKPLLAVVLMVVLDLVITWVKRGQFYLPTAAVVTGLLIGLIISPNGSFWFILIAVFFAWFSKHFLTIKTREHIFNPAAFGIFATHILGQTPISWWAVAWHKLLIFPIMAVVYTLFQLRRLEHPWLFLLTLYFYLLIQFSGRQAATLLIDGSVFLFAFIMVTEPMTSPAGGLLKFLWGPMIGGLVFILSLLGASADVFIPALLLANLAFFVLRRTRLKERRLFS